MVSRCFKPSQPQRITQGLRETFVKRYIVERTNRAELRKLRSKYKLHIRILNYKAPFTLLCI